MVNKPCRAVQCGAVAFLVAGCELAPEPDQVPASIEIAPNDTMVLVGDEFKLRTVVYDKDGEEMAGPPSWAPPVWWNDGDGAIEISTQGDVVAQGKGSLKIRAFLLDDIADAKLRVNPSSLLLTVPFFYFNQVNQNPEGTVPILANRRALLRVFVTGDETSYFRPNVRADFHRNGEIVHTVVIPPPRDELDTMAVEGVLANSYNTIVPGHVFQPGTELVIEVDPEGIIPRKPGSRARIPEQGTLPLDIMALKNFHQVIVPTVRTRSPNDVVNNSWSSGLSVDTEQMLLLRNYLPIADVTVEAHETLYTDANLGNFSGWLTYLREVQVLWQTEGQNGYYYGVVSSFAGSAIGGVASAIGWPPVSVGLDSPETFVHEIGHSMFLRHAPCGGAGGPDPRYPYANGRIGMWGYDFRGDSLTVDPSGNVYDVMSYCGPTWISDYHFNRAMEYRARSEGEANRPAPPQQTLLLWGSASEEEVYLEPAFLIESPPTVPAAGGPYRLEGFGPDGELRFGFNFTPLPVVDGDGAVFVFALPYAPDVDGTLERIVLSGPDGEDTLTPGSTPPMAIMRDGPDGPIRAFLRDWDGAVPAGLRSAGLQVQVHLSDGIPGGLR